MFTEDTLRQHLLLQDQLNSRIRSDWPSAGFHWRRAILVESVELLDHLGWKWWKKQEPDWDQARMELVDIWHFILSDAMCATEGHLEAAVHQLKRKFKEPEYMVPTAYVISDLRHLDIRETIEAFAGLAATGYVSITAFEMLCTQIKLPASELDVLYRSKNVLNLFRQAHGYKEGTYIKTWMGQEDNEVLTNLIRARPDATVEQLVSKLESIYSQIITA